MPTSALFSGSRCYFFLKSEYLRVTRGDTGPGTLDPGYPADILNWQWGSFAPHGIDAALHSGTKCYFFAGDQYIRVTRGDIGAGTIDSGYPKNISNWGWGNFAHNGTTTRNSPGIDAALYSGSRCYFFAGDQYIRVTRGDTGAGTIDSGYPKNISNWGWGNFGRHGIDAALHSGSKCYFFSGDEYIRVTRGDTGAGTIDPGYPRKISQWRWPMNFEDSWTTIGANYLFDNAITAGQRDKILERQLFAFSTIAGCGAISTLGNAELNALAATYRRPIRYGINTNPKANASAFVNRNLVFVNFAKLFPQGDDEIAQTLIHEMMHCAGYSHPNRRDPDSSLGQDCSSPDPANFDCPFDNGPYYGSPPLQAELCIAGDQSDLILKAVEQVKHIKCSIGEGGELTIETT